MSSTRSPHLVAVRYEPGVLRALDQTRLPFAEVELELRTAGEIAGAIKRLAIRGAPLLGVAGGYGVALAAASDLQSIEAHAATLRSARPTAVNLAYGVDRVLTAATAARCATDADAAALAEARAIEAEEIAASDGLAMHGAELLRDARRIVTHCNTGALAAPGRGTALAVVAELADRGSVELVLACEARPLLQGARLTTYELARLGIEHELIVDGAAAGLIAAGRADAVIVGCDRVAANGDVANKVGTLSLALAAAHAGIPFVVAGPTSTIDPSCPSGAAIEIEHRGGDEVRQALGMQLATADTACLNPAFDVTPASLVTALVTERGVARPVNSASVAALLASAR
jgi:methylthioribose-1-phosphate isomerase